MSATAATPDALADPSPRRAMLGLLRGLMAVGFGLARASGDYVRGLLDAGVKVTEAPPFDLDAVMQMLSRAVGWANALRCRLEAEGVALAVQSPPGQSVDRSLDRPAVPAAARAEALERAAPDRHRERQAAHVFWRPCEEPEWTAQIAGLTTEQVVAQICADMSGAAAVIGAGHAARRIERYWAAAKALLGAVPKALARPAFVLLAPEDDALPDPGGAAVAGPLRPG